MSTRNHAMNFSAKALTMGLLLASSSAFAQEVEPTPTVAPAAPPPVEATVQPVTPPPAVRTLPNENDRVAPQAAAEVAAEQAERATEPRRSAAPAPVRRATVTRAPVAAPSPVTDAVAPEAPVVADTKAITDSTPVAPIEEPVTEVAQADIAPVDNAAADNEWLIGAGIAGALGLAGIALIASRRRRRRSGDVVSETAPVAPVTYAEPREVARPVEQPLVQPAATPAFAAASPVDPLFSRPRHDMPVHNKYAVPTQRTDLPGVTDPLFAYKPVQTPVTDPMFFRTVAVPPITDPMFAKHPEYEGGGAARTGHGWNSASSDAEERTRELEPAE